MLLRSKEKAIDAQIDPQVIETLRGVSTATISTQLLARGLRSTYIAGAVKLHSDSSRMVGQAFTLRYVPAREDLDVLSVFNDYDHPQRKAIESIPPGSVLVMDARQQTRAACIGSILAARLKERGVEGIVTDGTVRDLHGIRGLGISTFAAGASPTTNLALHHACDIQLPVGCGEVAVYPGDIMVGDDDGVVCIPQDLAVEVANAGETQERIEEFLLQKVLQGAPLRGVYPPDEATLAEYRSATVE